MAEEIYLFSLEQDTLDRHLGGGLPIGSTLLMTGPDGAGKSILSQRICFGLLMNNYSVTYISTELTTKGFIDQMNSLSYPIMDFILSEKLLFIPVFPLIGTPAKRGNYLERFLSSEDLFRKDIIIVDSFSGLVKEELTYEKCLNTIAFLKKMCGKSKTIMITADPKELDAKVFSPISASFDIYLDLKLKLVEGKLSRVMYVNRYSTATSKVGDAIGFRVEPGAGFIIDITAVA